MFRAITLSLLSLSISLSVYGSEKPNVVLISVDDLNDWIGCLGGHPQARTPHMDRLAARGVLFSNAHCQSPVCNPSRVSLMTSKYPESTGIYFLSPELSKSDLANQYTTLPVRFDSEGYEVKAAGKLFHSRDNKAYFPKYAGAFGGFGPLPKKKLTTFRGVKLWDWGVFPENDEAMPDFMIANWGKAELANQTSQPFFLAVGFHRPHVPQYAPQKWFDLFPDDQVKLPEIIEDDLKDISPYAMKLTREQHVAPTQNWVVKNNELIPLVRSYLACVAFVDQQVGKILDALDASPYKDNTYIVLFSDHGFHLGEKKRWAKRSLWEDGTRVPLMIAGPGVPQGKVCQKPTELIDIYPTLLELAGMEKDPELEGQSLVPLLKQPESDWPHMARTSFGPGNYSIRSERYRYIHYNDDSEEFYDHEKDPHEWHNLINNPEVADIVARHRKHAPASQKPFLGKSSTGHKAYRAAEAGN